MGDDAPPCNTIQGDLINFSFSSAASETPTVEVALASGGRQWEEYVSDGGLPRVGVVRQNHETLHQSVEMPVAPPKARKFSILVNEVSCRIPFSGVLSITTHNSGETRELPVQGEVELRHFGNLRAEPTS